MGQEGKGKFGLAPEAGDSGAQRRANLAQVDGAEIGELLALEIPPEIFDGIEVRRVPGQPFHRQPAVLAGQIGRPAAALVGGQTVPDEDDGLTPEVALEVLVEGDQPGAIVAARQGLEVEAAPRAVPAKGQRRGDGESGPVEGVGQDGRLAPRGPRAPDGGPLGDPPFVLEDDPGPPASWRGRRPGPCSPWGHHWRTRSRGRGRAGRASQP